MSAKWMSSLGSGGALGRSFLVLTSSACAPAVGACGAPPAQHAPPHAELELNAPLPADPPPPPQLKPCLIGDSEGCSTAKKHPGGLDKDRRYQIPVATDDPTLGPANAPVTVVIFSDFQCPYCARMSSIIENLREDFPEQVRVVWKDMPLPMHRFAAPAALLGRAAYAAGGNAKFWQAHEEIYDRQATLSDEVLAQIAGDLQIPWPTSKQLSVHVDRDFDLAGELGVDSTPSSFINGRPIVGAKPFDVFAELVKQELKR